MSNEASSLVNDTPDECEQQLDILNNDDYVGQLTDLLAKHLSEEPKKPVKGKLLYNNTTPEALFRGMIESGASVGLISDEGGNIFNSKAMNDLATLNQMRDGSPIIVDRVGTGNNIVREPRFTFMGMIQPGVLRKFYENRGDEALDIGFFARTFVSNPSSTQGTRYIQHVQPSLKHLPQFHERVEEILNQNVEDLKSPEFRRPTLEFSAKAQQLWIDAYNQLESKLYLGQYFADVSDYGSKFGENQARLAALFHFFIGEEGDISYETTSRALAICEWFLYEFKRLFSAPPEVPQEVSDAGLIEAMLAELLRTNCCTFFNNVPYVKKNDILQSGPKRIRNKFRLDAALNYMAINNRVRIVKFEKTKFVELNWYYFSNMVNFPPAQIVASNQSQLPMSLSGRW